MSILGFMQEKNNKEDFELSFRQFHNKVDKFNGGLGFNNIDEAQQTLSSFSQQFEQFQTLLQRPDQDAIRREYSVVRKALSTEIPAKISRLQSSKPTINVNLGRPGRDPDQSTPSSISMAHGSPRHDASPKGAKRGKGGCSCVIF